MDSHALVTNLHAEILRILSDRTGVHYAGLQQGARDCMKKDLLDRKTTKKLCQLDVACAIVRHVTKSSSANLVSSVKNQVGAAAVPAEIQIRSQNQPTAETLRGTWEPIIQMICSKVRPDPEVFKHALQPNFDKVSNDIAKTTNEFEKAFTELDKRMALLETSIFGAPRQHEEDVPLASMMQEEVTHVRWPHLHACHIETLIQEQERPAPEASHSGS